LGGNLFEILAAPFAGDLLFFGNGGRFGDPSWAAEMTLVPGGTPVLDDLSLSEEVLTLMRTVAVDYGAPGLMRER